MLSEKMTKGNNLEKTILKAAKNAQEIYCEMTGYWLWHAPEHFFQNVIARAIWKNGHNVFIDASNGKVKRDAEDNKKRGRPRKDTGKRFDISVWYKRTKTLKAVIEIKRGYSLNFNLVKKDAEKIEYAVNSSKGAKSGYILLYSEIKDKKALQGLFCQWAKDLEWRLVDSFVTKPHDEEYAWGVALFRYNRPVYF